MFPRRLARNPPPSQVLPPPSISAFCERRPRRQCDCVPSPGFSAMPTGQAPSPCCGRAQLVLFKGHTSDGTATAPPFTRTRITLGPSSRSLAQHTRSLWIASIFLFFVFITFPSGSPLEWPICRSRDCQPTFPPPRRCRCYHRCLPCPAPSTC